MKHEWVVKPKRWIDPYKEANANAVALKTGQKTFQQICAESGRDWKKVVDEMAEAREYAEEKGINLDTMLFGIATGGGKGDEEVNDKKQKGSHAEKSAG